MKIFFTKLENTKVEETIGTATWYSNEYIARHRPTKLENANELQTLTPQQSIKTNLPETNMLLETRYSDIFQHTNAQTWTVGGEYQPVQQVKDLNTLQAKSLTTAEISKSPKLRTPSTEYVKSKKSCKQLQAFQATDSPNQIQQTAQPWVSQS